MSSMLQQQSTPKGPRRSPRRPRNTPSGDEAALSHASDFDSSAAPSNAESNFINESNEARRSRKKKKPQGPKKTPGESSFEGDVKLQNNLPQAISTDPVKVKATPIKQQAYAGPTFHHSPAPSALPIPSFYSRSVPNVSIIRPAEAANDVRVPLDQQQERTSPQNAKHTEVQMNRDATPLDFLFEAAKKARETPRAESPGARSVNVSAYGDSPYNRSPAPREGDFVFPFELEGGTGSPGAIGAPFATPYKDRMDALRSTSASTAPKLDLSENEARAKSEALKKFMNLPPHATSTSGNAPDMYNPFNARTPQIRNEPLPAPQARHRSGPSTPVSGMRNGSMPSQYFPNMQPPGYNGPIHGSPMHRPASSHLRHLYQPSVETSPVELASNGVSSPPLISTARKPPMEHQHQTPRQASGGCDGGSVPLEQMSGHRSKPSAQQLEDELRRVLKLDLTSRG